MAPTQGSSVTPIADAGPSPIDATADLALRSAEARFNALFEHAQVGVLLADSQSRYFAANESICRMLGYTRDELARLGAADIVVPAEAVQITPAIESLAHGDDDHRQWRFRRKDGSTLPVEVVATRMPDGTLLGTVKDLSEREQANEIRERLAAIVSSSLDGIIGEDLDGRITSWNAGAKAMFGHDARDMIGSTVARLIPPERLHERAIAHAAHLSGAGAATIETQRLTRDRTLLDVSITTSPIHDAEGRLVGLSKIVRDITPLKQRERELSRLFQLHAALSGINQAIALAKARDELFTKVCEVLVDRGGFRAAWIGWHDEEAGRLVPVAHRGDNCEALASTDDDLDGQVPPGRAFRSGRAIVSNDSQGEPALLFYRPVFEALEIRSMASLPIHRAGAVCAVINIYSERRNFFPDKEVSLLQEAAFDISSALDSEARDKAKEESDATLRNEKLFSDTMIESFPGILYFYDAGGHFLRWNHNFEKVTGYSAIEVSSMHPLDFFAPEERPRMQERIGAAFEDGEVTVEANLRLRDGSTRPYLLTGHRVEFAGGPCLIGAGIDISAQRRAEAERERRHRAEAADRVKSAFLATMSHELRTPLNSIIGFSGILLQGLAGPLNPEQGKQLGMVQNSARHLLALVNDVLDISKIEAGQLEVGRHPFDPRGSIEKVLGLVAQLATAKHLTLRHHLADGLGVLVGDARRFEQILLNLLSNAIKFTEDGEVTLSAHPVAAYRPPGAASARPAIRICVTDSGIGIRPEELSELFEPFRQVRNEKARSQDGTGLGLSICRKLARLMDGEVTAESRLGKGSIFTVMLPLQSGEAP